LQAEIECEKLGIPVYTLNSRELSEGLDLTIDGADEVDPKNFMVKGGGGAMLIEKLAAYSSSSFAIVADETKLVESLGTGFPVPVEVVPEARVQVTRALEKLGAFVIIREALRKAGPVITEHGNIILDIRFQASGLQVSGLQTSGLQASGLSTPVDPEVMETKLNEIPGVVENGFFTRKPPVIYIAHNDGSIETRGKK
jgi:ribose 5-phosphate isomerase A